MQEQPEKDQDQQAPLSSEAPDPVQQEEQAAETPDAQALAEAAEVADSSGPLTDGSEQPAPDETTGEQPDGLVAEAPDDLLADANAVDPKIDVGLLEAYLFATHSPLTPGRLAELFNLESTKPIRKALRVLNEQYAATGRCFRVEQVAGGFQLLTLPDYGDHLKALHQREQDAKLTKAALETLAIIAYKQPILRADLEAIRGVASGETIRSLMEKHLVKIAGRAEEPGRPILYGTTKRFLEVFGLNSLKDLPHPDSPQNKQLSRAAQTLLSDSEPAAADVPATVEGAAEAAPAVDAAVAGETPAAETAPAEAPASDLPSGAEATEGEANANEPAPATETPETPETSETVTPDVEPSDGAEGSPPADPEEPKDSAL